MHRVVIGADAQAAAADRDIGVGGDTLALAAVAGVENDLAALDQNGAAGVQAVLLAQQVQHAAGDGDRALRAVLVVGGVERVGAHVGVQDAALDADAVLAGETLAARLQVHGAALELQVVLGDHGVALQTADVQHTLPAESQVAFGEDGRVHLVLVRLDEFPAGLDQVLAARLGGENQLVGAERVDGRVAAFEDRDAAQDQLDLGILRRVHDDLAVGEGTGEQVIARGGDGDGAAVDLDAAVGAGTAAVAEGDEDGVALRLGGGDGGAEGGERQRGEGIGRRGVGAAAAEQADRERGAERAGQNFMCKTHGGNSFHSSLCSVDCSPREISRLPLRQRSSSIMAFSQPGRLSVSS